MRGLVAAGRAVRLGRSGWSRSGRDRPRRCRGRLSIAVSRVVPSRCDLIGEGQRGLRRGLLEHGQGPYPAGELAGDRHVGDHRLLPSRCEGLPPLVQPAVPFVAAGQPPAGGAPGPAGSASSNRDGGRSCGDATRPPLTAGGRSCCGLGDRPLRTGPAGGVTRWAPGPGTR